MRFRPLTLAAGALKEALDLFEKHSVNLTHLESKPAKDGSASPRAATSAQGRSLHGLAGPHPAV